MLIAGARCLAALVPLEDRQQGILFPPLRDIRDISVKVAAEVARQALREGVAEGITHHDTFTSADDLATLTQDELEQMCKARMWNPAYSTLVYKPR
mmetsp:Transcript_522/g.1868  ORF Transcript_522/g.1868 Transcript_522/m.1868 type:complete len:96 (+) Transcript_522:1874-2161(+)